MLYTDFSSTRLTCKPWFIVDWLGIQHGQVSATSATSALVCRRTSTVLTGTDSADKRGLSAAIG